MVALFSGIYLDPLSPHQLKQSCKSWAPSDKAFWTRTKLANTCGNKVNESIANYLKRGTLANNIYPVIVDNADGKKKSYMDI